LWQGTRRGPAGTTQCELTRLLLPLVHLAAGILFVLKYSDFGADMYGLALVTRKKFADENP
jgi:hypothetical protein